MNVSTSKLYTFTNFTDLTDEESNEVLLGRNAPAVRRWMTSDRVISADEHRRFRETLKNNTNSIYIRIERSGKFVGVYSLNHMTNGTGLGGFWVTSYSRERLLPLNVVFHGMDYMFTTFGVNRIYGYQRGDNLSAIRLNSLLGLVRIKSACDNSNDMEQIEITSHAWQQKTRKDAKLIKMMNRLELLNGTN